MLLDDHAIDRLVAMLGEVDETYSSLWRKQVAGIRFENGELTSLTGFGSWEPRHSRLKGVVHRLLQERYRRHGCGLPQFAQDERAGAEIAAAQKRNYNLDILRQVITLAFLRQHIPARRLHGRHRRRLWHLFQPGAQARTASARRCDQSAAGVAGGPGVSAPLLPRRARRVGRGPIAVRHGRSQPACHRAVRAPLRSARAVPMGLAVNMVSMQEIDPPVIARYFEAMRHSARPGPAFYCCSREEKTLPNGTVTRFQDYPWQPEDRILVDELCAWNQDYHSTRPPFYRPYDGPIRHRLLRLAPPAR